MLLFIQIIENLCLKS